MTVPSSAPVKMTPGATSGLDKDMSLCRHPPQLRSAVRIEAEDHAAAAIADEHVACFCESTEQCVADRDAPNFLSRSRICRLDDERAAAARIESGRVARETQDPGATVVGLLPSARAGAQIDAVDIPVAAAGDHDIPDQDRLGDYRPRIVVLEREIVRRAHRSELPYLAAIAPGKANHMTGHRADDHLVPGDERGGRGRALQRRLPRWFSASRVDREHAPAPAGDVQTAAVEYGRGDVIFPIIVRPDRPAKVAAPQLTAAGDVHRVQGVVPAREKSVRRPEPPASMTPASRRFGARASGRLRVDSVERAGLGAEQQALPGESPKPPRRGPSAKKRKRIPVTDLGAMSVKARAYCAVAGANGAATAMSAKAPRKYVIVRNIPRELARRLGGCN